MKLVFHVMLVLACAVPVLALDKRPSEVDRKILRYCDEVCELESQDQAFALLTESFRQYRSFRIQARYEMRISAASAFSDKNGSLMIESNSEGMRMLRGWVLHLAEQERERGLQELQQQVEHMEIGYGCVRKLDEERIGRKVVRKTDQAAAAQELEDYLIIAAGTPIKGTLHTIDPIPASTVFLNAAPVIPGETRKIPRCEE